VVFTVFLGLLFGGVGDSRLPLAVYDEDQTAASVELLDTLSASPLIEPRVMSADEVEKAVHDQEVAAGLVVPRGYQDRLEADETADLTLVRLETSTGAQTLQRAVDSVVGRLNSRVLVSRVALEQISSELETPPGDELVATAESLAAAALDAPAVGVETAVSSTGTGEIASGFEQSSSGSIVSWVLFGLLTVATGMAWERRHGLLRRLNAEGVRPAEIVGGKILAMVMISFVQQLFLVLVGQLAFGVDFFQSPLGLLMVMISLSMFAASLGLLISSLFRSEQAIVATTVISAQLLGALGGAWFPLEVTSASFSRVAHALPTSWLVDSLHGIILKGWGPGNLLIPLAVTWGWVIVLFAAAIWRFRPE